MKTIIKNPDNSERLLRMLSDTLILINRDGICIDIAVYNTNLWFLKEDELIGKNILKILPLHTFRKIYPEFQKVLTLRTTSTHNYKLPLPEKTYFFKCIMQPYNDMVLCQYRDITERSERKLELERMNYELNEIQKAALIGRWKYNTTTHIFTYSGHTNVMCKEEEQYMPIESYLNNILPEDRTNFNKWLKRSIDGNIEDYIDYRIQHNQNVYYIRLKTFASEHNKNGDLILEGYIQNITDIQQRRNDINLLTHAINNSTEEIFAARENGMLLFANHQFRQHIGIDDTDDITQFNIYKIRAFTPNEQQWEHIVNSIKKEEKHIGFVVYSPFPLHPEVLAYEGNAYRVISDEGLKTIWVFGRDISQRIHHEQQIKRFNQILDKIIENLPAGIIVKDIGNGFKYMYRNRESYNRNMSISKPSGEDDFDFYPTEIAEEKRKEDIQIATTGQEIHYITEEHDINGKPLFLDKRKMIIEDKDFSPVLLSIEWDITDIELMKRELLAAKEKAETSDHLKSAFLANMSHEIRTPLNAIVGFSRIIAESENTDERKEYYNIVESNNERLLQLINEILDLSKIEAGIVEFNITPVHLYPLCKEIYDALVFRCPKDVELIFEPSNKYLKLESDKNRIFQVISNLIGNAFKFTQKGSICYGYSQEGENIIFHVSDTGSGIPSNQINQVFDRFVKANTFAQGTGLGLAICKTIIEHLGGTIVVTSEIGKGTTFTFTLPVQTEKSRKEPTKECDINIPITIHPVPDKQLVTETEIKQEEKTRNKAKTSINSILVAEDMDSNYLLVESILKPIYHLQRAQNGKEAIDLFRKTNPDLILMDIRMPVIDGLEATKIIKSLSPNTPIIALTAFAYEEDNQAALAAGCSDFLTKPFKQEILKETIKKWLKKIKE